MDDEHGVERRKFPRYDSPDVQVAYKPLDPLRWSSYQGLLRRRLKDISMGGVCFRVEEKIAERLPIALDILLGKKMDPIKTFGRVAWAKESDAKQYEMGVSFNWWAKEEDKKALVKFIEQQAV